MSRKLTQEEAEAKSLAVGIRMVGRYLGDRIDIEFICPECNNIFLARPNNIFYKNTKRCKICYRKITSNNGRHGAIKNSNSQYKGTKNISSTYWSRLKLDAKKRNLEFNITKEYAQNIFDLQQAKCNLTGLEIITSRNRRKKNLTYKEQTASLDRIDSTIGYIEGNIQWLHKNINKMKMDFSTEQFIKYCQLVVQKNINNV